MQIIWSAEFFAKRTKSFDEKHLATYVHNYRRQSTENLQPAEDLSFHPSATQWAIKRLN